MAAVKKQLLEGTMLDSNPMVYHSDDKIQFRLKNDPTRGFSLSGDLLEKHLLLLGGPGSGKTNVIKIILHWLRYYASSDDVFIIFDPKGDYLESFYQEGDIVIASGARYRRHPGFRTWNIYHELEAAGADWELAAREISASLFADRKNQHSPFFTNAPKDIFANLLIHFYRRKDEHPELLNNRSLVETIKSSGVEFYQDIFSEEKNPDMVGLNSYFGSGTGSQGLGVFGEMKNMVYDSFVDAFAEDSGRNGFSIRKAVRNRGARAVFIEYDLASGQALTPIYRLLIDLAQKEALGRTGRLTDNPVGTPPGRVWFELDELKLLPHCRHLEDTLNLGRGLGCSVIAGLQSVEQMYNIYGRSGGQVICGGFSSIFAFSVSDPASREYISNLFGRNLYSYRYDSSETFSSATREREGYVVEDWDIQALSRGKAIIGLNNTPPFLFEFEKYWGDTPSQGR